MSLPFELSSIDDAPENVRDFYTRVELGDRVVYRLDVEGHVAEGDVGRLRTTYAGELAVARAALEKANAALTDLEAEPVTIDDARADDDAIKRARRDLDRAAGNGGDDDDAGGGNDDDGADDAAALLAAAKSEHAELEAALAERRLRDELEPRIRHVRSAQLRADILRVALERYRVDDKGRVVPVNDGDDQFDFFLAGFGGSRSLPSLGAGAVGSGGRQGGATPNATVEAFRAGRATLTELAREARRNPDQVLPNVQQLLRSKR